MSSFSVKKKNAANAEPSTVLGLGGAYLESRVVELAFAKLLESVADLPFVDSLAALYEFIKLLSNTHLGATVLEEPHIQRFLRVLGRPLRHALGAPKLLQRHFRSLNIRVLQGQ